MTDRVAIVTGASGGIGHAVAVRLAQAGMPVAVHYAGNRTAPRRSPTRSSPPAARDCRGRRYRRRGRGRSPVRPSRAEFGGVDVVVNTAGIMLFSPLTELNLDDFDRMHRTNVRGTFVVSQQAARRVREGGAIINFSSSVTKLALPTYTAYAATKGAVDAMTLTLAKELRGRDITVNAIAPGPTATPLFLDGKASRPSTPCAPCLRWSASAPPRTSQKPPPSSPARLAGSTARSSTPTAVSSEMSTPNVIRCHRRLERIRRDDACELLPTPDTRRLRGHAGHRRPKRARRPRRPGATPTSTA